MEQIQRIVKHLTPVHLKIEALRAITDSISVDGIISVLVADGVFTEEDIAAIGLGPVDMVEGLYKQLVRAEKRGDLALMEFSWTLLPQRQAKLEVVTPAARRVFGDV